MSGTPIKSVYLVIHSQSLVASPKDKPSFRVASAELHRLPDRWAGHDHNNYRYTNILVTPFGTTTAEEWKIELEYSRNPEQDLEIVAWFNDLEAADKKLADCVVQGCKSHADTNEGNTEKKKARVTWTDSLDGNSTAFYRIKSKQKNWDGSMSRTTRCHWYEIIRINLEQEDVYGTKWHEKARLSYLETSERINALLTLRRAQGLSVSETEELDGLQRGLGWVSVARDRFGEVTGYTKRGEEDSDGVREFLDNENVQYSSEDEEDKRVRKLEPGYGNLDLKDPDVMGDNVWGDKL
jgi:hypothetical protein